MKDFILSSTEETIKLIDSVKWLLLLIRTSDKIPEKKQKNR